MEVYKRSEDELEEMNQAVQKEQTAQPAVQSGQWQEQLDGTIDKILNREQFTYDMDSDAMYEQMKDQYIRQGQMAMMDTMGKAATMTGGYGNSYAQGVGQQTYQGYLQGFHDTVPELYQMALDAYIREGQALSDRYAVLTDKVSSQKAEHADQRSEELQAAKLMAGFGDYSLLAKYYGWTDEYMDGLVNPEEESVAAGNGGNQTNYTGNPGWDEETIREFQETHGLTVDGIWGPETAAAYDNDPNWGVIQDDYYEDLLSAVVITKGSYSKQNWQTRQKAYQKTVAAINDAYEQGEISTEQKDTLLKIAIPGGR